MLSVRLEGHLTREKLRDALATVTPSARSAGPAVLLLLDCSQMISYDLDARHAFVEWLRDVRPAKVAILTDRALWRMVISGMSLAAGVPLQAFSAQPDAEAWLGS